MEAESYAVKFIWEGKSFKVMLQTRVNMDDTEQNMDDTKQNRVNMDDTIMVPDGNNRGSEYFVTADEENIRPYGILVKEM